MCLIFVLHGRNSRFFLGFQLVLITTWFEFLITGYIASTDLKTVFGNRNGTNQTTSRAEHLRDKALVHDLGRDPGKFGCRGSLVPSFVSFIPFGHTVHHLGQTNKSK